MNSSIIKVEQLSKRYLIQSNKAGYRSLREEFMQQMNNVLNRKTRKTQEKEFYAIRNISFNIDQGKVVGLIGKNGAGKSTLLKLLGRITHPTAGKIKIKGRIASLLEVGTGFHPELTGRENIYLSGAILGMTKKEINNFFDEIVDFSGVEKFLDVPVKRYSSGMSVRLGFAVAAHLQAEVLLIDEVLAVGDLAFQNKCLGKISEVSKSGRTIVFVSHNMRAIKQLCDSCIVLDKGQVLHQGNVDDSLKKYIDLNQQNQRVALKNQSIRDIFLLNDNKLTSAIKSGSNFELRVKVELENAIVQPVLGIVIRDRFNVPVVGINNRHFSIYFDEVVFQKGTFTITIPTLNLMAGTYQIDLFLGDIYEDFETIQNALSFTVLNSETYSISTKLEPSLNRILVKKALWNIQHDDGREA